MENRATISKGGPMFRLLACVVPVVLQFAFFTTIVSAQTEGGSQLQRRQLPTNRQRPNHLTLTQP
jgi:hypothetical protein